MIMNRMITSDNHFILYYIISESQRIPATFVSEQLEHDETSCIIIYYRTGRKSYSKVLHFWSQKIVPRMAWILTFQAIALVLALTS